MSISLSSHFAHCYAGRRLLHKSFLHQGVPCLSKCAAKDCVAATDFYAHFILQAFAAFLISPQYKHAVQLLVT